MAWFAALVVLILLLLASAAVWYAIQPERSEWWRIGLAAIGGLWFLSWTVGLVMAFVLLSKAT